MTQTHNVALTSPVADNIITVGLDGVAHAVGNDISVALAVDPTLARELELEKDKLEVENEAVDTETKEGKKSDGKLIMAEEIEEGRVSWKSMELFFKGLGGDNPVLFLGAWVLAFILMHGGNMFGVWFLGFWGSKYETNRPEDVPVSLYVVGKRNALLFMTNVSGSSYLTFYSLILFGAVCIYGSAMILYNYGAMRASKKINGMLVDSMLGSTLRLVAITIFSSKKVSAYTDISQLVRRNPCFPHNHAMHARYCRCRRRPPSIFFGRSRIGHLHGSPFSRTCDHDANHPRSWHINRSLGDVHRQHLSQSSDFG